jgi:regulator of cell morphogenesis and NO signaling
MPHNVSASFPTGQPPPDELPIPALLDLILDTHHVLARDLLSRLQECAAAIPPADLVRDERLPRILEAVAAVSDEMLSHMHREEAMLFPVLRQIAASGEADATDMEIITPPIECMQREHGLIDELLDYLHQLTDGFQAPEWATPVHRELLEELAAFATDTAEHVRKENVLLFPKALALA